MKAWHDDDVRDVRASDKVSGEWQWKRIWASDGGGGRPDTSNNTAQCVSPDHSSIEWVTISSGELCQTSP